MTKPTLQCPHGVDVPFACEKCARAERRAMATPTVGLMAATIAAPIVNSGWEANADRTAEVAWALYEAVCKRCAE